MHNRAELSRELGPWHSTAIVVGIIIGSGIFFVPQEMMADLGSAKFVFLAWVVGGILTWAGALTYAELGAMKPGAGGEYVYVRDAYGPLMGFLYAWTWFTIGKPASIASVCAAMVRTLGSFEATAFVKDTVITAPVTVTWGHLLVSAIIIGFTVLNYLGVKKAGDFQVVFTTLKVGLIAGIILLAFSYSGGTTANYATTVPATTVTFAGFMAALIAALWAYDGWNNLVMVAGEIKNPERNIPLALIAGIAIVGTVYLAMAAALQYVLPAPDLATATSPAAAAIQRVLGAAGAMFISLGIAMNLLVSINGQILTGARIPFAAARDGYFDRRVAQVSPRYHTPSVALAFQAVVTIALFVLGGQFSDLFNLAIFAAWLFYMIAASTIFVFRKREPDAPRAYRTWGYPVLPALFILASTVLLYYSFMEKIENSIVGSIVILAGIPVFYFYRSKNRAA